MLDFKQRNIIDSCGDTASWKGKFTDIGKLKNDGPDFEKEKYVFGACAGAALYRKELFKKIGLFDEDFFAYLEDVDISFRAQIAGFKCVFVPKAIVYHIGSGTAGKKSGFIFKLVIKNRWHVIYKNFPISRIIIFSPLILWVEFRFFLAAIIHGFIKEYFWGVKNAFLEHKKMILKRKKIQDSRKVTLKYLDNLMGNL
jgi:GT2 family glycosyltransferase